MPGDIADGQQYPAVGELGGDVPVAADAAADRGRQVPDDGPQPRQAERLIMQRQDGPLQLERDMPLLGQLRRQPLARVRTGIAARGFVIGRVVIGRVVTGSVVTGRVVTGRVVTGGPGQRRTARRALAVRPDGCSVRCQHVCTGGQHSCTKGDPSGTLLSRCGHTSPG